MTAISKYSRILIFQFAVVDTNFFLGLKSFFPLLLKLTFQLFSLLERAHGSSLLKCQIQFTDAAQSALFVISTPLSTQQRLSSALLCQRLWHTFFSQFLSQPLAHPLSNSHSLSIIRPSKSIFRQAENRMTLYIVHHQIFNPLSRKIQLQLL